MKAKDFFYSQLITDVYSVIDKTKSKYTREELFKFAEAYGSVEWQDGYNKGRTDGSLNPNSNL
jgi:hypothetical protein